MKLKPIINKIYSPIIEANLTGKSRSGGTSNWEYYIVKDFNKENKYVIETEGDVIDEKFNVIGKVKKGEAIQILSTQLLIKGKSGYANCKVVSSGLVGYISLSNIQKPTTSKKDNESEITSVIPGGTGSKEFTPDKLGLTGIKFSNSTAMASVIQSKLQTVYGGVKYFPVRKYLYACINSTLGTTLTESFTKTYNLKDIEPISSSDISILSKNFGEVIGALYILQTNKKAKHVEFPTDISQGLYDFIMVEKSGITNYYSAKSKGGSSTSIGNVDFVLKNFSESNVLLKNNKHEVDVIRSLMNNKKEGITTILNIQNFFDKHLSDKKNEILKRINAISKVKINSLSQSDLTRWFNSMINDNTQEQFISTMNSIYTSVLGDTGKVPKATNDVLIEMYKSGDGSKYNHGYLLYPMGSYIVGYLNNTGNYKEILNVILNYGSFVHTFYTDMSDNKMTVSIMSFKTQSFKFSYNAGAKYPGNRPIGFIKE